MNKTGKIWQAYEHPFCCDDETATIKDKNGYPILTMRGWSYLSKLFEHEDAFKLQLEVAHFLADKLNELKCEHHYVTGIDVDICLTCNKIK